MSLPPIGRQEIRAREPLQKFKGHTGLVRDIIHLPGGQRTLTCSEDGSLRLWNLESGLQIGSNWRDGKSAVVTMALSPDGQTVVSGSGDGAVRLWDIETGKVIVKWTGHGGVIWSVSWSQDGQRVVSGSIDGTARVWDVYMKNGKKIHGIINTGHIYVFAAVFSPDETMIATGGSGDKKINIWNTKTFELVKTLKGHKEHVYSLAWTADGRTLISGSADDASGILTWNTTTWEQHITFLPEHTDVIRAIAISPNQRILASASWDCTARLWNLENGHPVGSPLQHAGDVDCISFSADGRLLATGCDDNNAYTWDIAAFVIDAGLDHPLSAVDSDHPSRTPQNTIRVRKSVLDTKATRRVAKSFNDKQRLPERIFDNGGNRIQSPSTRPPPCPRSSSGQSSVSRAHALLDCFSSLFRRSHTAFDGTTHTTQTPFRSLTRTPAHFSQCRRPDDEQRLHTVEVPCTRGLRRYIKPVIPQPKKTLPVTENIMIINITDTSRPPMSDAAQHSSDLIHYQELLPQPQHFNTTTVDAHAITMTTSTAGTPSTPIIVINRPRRWTRFWLCLGRISFDDALD